MKRYALYFLLGLVLAGCKRDNYFCVEGQISEAADTVMYLEHITLADGVVPIDSVRLTAEGTFRMKGKTEGNPEFYRLRIGGDCINLAIDSTETVRVAASLRNMSFGYTVEGSGTCDTIRLLSLKLAALEKKIRAMAEDRNYTLQERDSNIYKMIEAYKFDVKRQFILNHYAAASSYYACFQVLAGRLLFDPVGNANDLMWVSAVANAWAARYPGRPRTENLLSIVKEGRRNQAKPREIVLDLNHEKVRELGIIDMTMPDINGREVSLSSLRGKVVLLDFTAFSLPASQERILQLRDLYKRYHARGFEIYQVSVDADRHLWAQRCENLPWVSVFCEEGLDSDMLKLYGVDHLPYYFLIDRNCDLQARQENISNLRQSIEALL